MHAWQSELLRGRGQRGIQKATENWSVLDSLGPALWFSSHEGTSLAAAGAKAKEKYRQPERGCRVNEFVWRYPDSVLCRTPQYFEAERELFSPRVRFCPPLRLQGKVRECGSLNHAGENCTDSAV